MAEMQDTPRYQRILAKENAVLVGLPASMRELKVKKEGPVGENWNVSYNASSAYRELRIMRHRCRVQLGSQKELKFA